MTLKNHLSTSVCQSSFWMSPYLHCYSLRNIHPLSGPNFILLGFLFHMAELKIETFLMKGKTFVTSSSTMTILTYGDRYHWELYSYYVEMWESSYFFAIWSSCSSRSLDNLCRKLWWCIEVGGEVADVNTWTPTP